MSFRQTEQRFIALALFPWRIFVRRAQRLKFKSEKLKVISGKVIATYGKIAVTEQGTAKVVDNEDLGGGIAQACPSAAVS